MSDDIKTSALIKRKMGGEAIYLQRKSYLFTAYFRILNHVHRTYFYIFRVNVLLSIIVCIAEEMKSYQ
ncbi:hypothetical protein BM526_01100 [Alteromonas mediterranea]|nr:hypothetical protein BM526_01100 [Alteromonas mediterranea]